MNISIPDYLSPDIISLFGDREVYVDYCHISTRADIVKDILKGRVFLFFGVSEVNGKFVSAEPERIAFSAPDGSPYAKYNRRFQKSAARKLKPKKVAAVIAEKQLRLARLNEEHLDTMLAQSKKDYEFVLRFNEEMYFKHIPDSDGFLNSAASYAIQNKQALCIFISAYALAFLGLSLSDIFTIKSIFDFDAAQNTRLTDNLKKQAGLDVYALLSKGEGKLGVIPFAEIYAALNKTAEDNKYDKDDYNLRVLHYATDTGLMAMYTVLGILDGLINR